MYSRDVSLSTADAPLGSDDIHLWLVDYELVEERLHDAYRSLLSEQEREQESRFHFARDRRRYLVTRALVRTVLSRYVPIRPQDWSFKADYYGRPRIENVVAQHEQLTFNISHTHSLIVLGVGRDRELGVDVENVAAREVSLDLAERFFAAEEAAALARVPAAGQQQRFFEYWTLKESYIKARGMGLSLPLDKFAFRYPDNGAVKIAIDPCLSDDPARWRFWQCKPSAPYLLAVCAERGRSGRANISARRVIPLEGDICVSLDFLRTSS
jgi:4'-phosphopantetheinyl transferase